MSETKSLKHKAGDKTVDVTDDVNKLKYADKRKQFLECLKTGEWCEMEKFLPDALFWSPVECYGKVIQLPWMTQSVDELKPLEMASMYGHVEIVKNLLALEESQCYGKQEAILQAARGGHKECFHLLVEDGFLKANDRDHQRYSQEIQTVKAGDFVQIEASLKSATVGAGFNEVTCNEKWATSRRVEIPVCNFSLYPKSRITRDQIQRDHVVSPDDLVESDFHCNYYRTRAAFDRDWPVDFMNLLIVHGCPSSCLKVLVDQKIEVNSFDKNGLTPLMCAVLAENLEALHFLLKHRVNFDSQILTANFWLRKTALMYAATLKNSDCLEAMLSYCSKDDINVKQYKFKRTALTFACIYGITKSVKLLIESGAEVETKDHSQNNLVIAAMDSGNVDCLKLILESVSRDNFEYIMDERAFDFERKLQNLELFRVFLDHFPLPIDTIFGNGKTLLGLAVSYGFEEIVCSLLDKGANIDCIDTFGESALMCSCRKGHHNLTKLLIEKGAKVDLENKDRSSAVIYAVYFRQYDCLKLLLAVDADIRKSNNQGDTVVSIACRFDDHYCVKLLLDSGKLLKPGDLELYKTSYHRYSCRETLNSVKALTLLLNAGILNLDSSLHHRNKQRIFFTGVSMGICPARFHFYSNYEKVYEELSVAGLLEQDKDILKDKYGKVSPLVLAITDGNYPAVKYLLGNLYFYVEDYNRLRKEEIFSYSTFGERAKVSALLDSVTHNPMRLQAWSVLAASKAISTAGPPTHRQERVEALPIPDKLKRILKFQTELSRTCCKSWHTLDDFSPCDLMFSQTKKAAILGNSIPFCEACRA